jgi:ubiquinone/menaquinone biosynthesis C-methylase UbiE
MLLDALVGFGQLAKQDSTYRLSPGTEGLLAVPGADAQTYFADALVQTTAQLNDARQLTEVIRTGSPVANVADPEAGAQFFVRLARLLFVHNYPTAQALFRQVRAEFARGPVAILDVAAGGAPWSMPFAQGNRQARVTAVDFPSVLEVARHFARASGVEERYDLRPGDLRRVPFGEGQFDVAILGHICHSEGPKHTPRLLRKVARALKPGGAMIILDFVADDARAGQGPASFPLLFALNMLLHTAEGDTFTFSQYREWGKAAGFKKMEAIDLPAPSPALVFRK